MNARLKSERGAYPGVDGGLLLVRQLPGSGKNKFDVRRPRREGGKCEFRAERILGHVARRRVTGDPSLFRRVDIKPDCGSHGGRLRSDCLILVDHVRAGQRPV